MNATIRSFWPQELASTVNRYQPTWQQWRQRRATHSCLADDQLASAARPLDSSLAAFTPREIERLRFLRWLVNTERLIP